MTNQELRDIRDEIDAEQPKETDCYGTNGFCGERHCQTCKQIYENTDKTATLEIEMSDGTVARWTLTDEQAEEITSRLPNPDTTKL